MLYFHGIKGRRSFFEGWYFKHQKGEHSIAFIPAVLADGNGRKTAVLQILTEKQSWQLSYPLCEFNSEEEQLSVRMDNSFFTERGCTLNIREKDLTLVGRIDYGPLLMLDKDIMGPFRFMPWIQCRHGIVSLFHSLSGELTINNEKWDFNDGIGYIEMDWGRSFPKRYTWMHAAWNEEKENCIMLAAARVPAGIFSFKGCIGCLLYNGKQVVLATYFGAKIIQWDFSQIIIQQAQLRLEATCLMMEPKKTDIKEQGVLRGMLHESLQAKVHIRIYEKDECTLDKIIETASFEAADENKKESA